MDTSQELQLKALPEDVARRADALLPAMLSYITSILLWPELESLPETFASIMRDTEGEESQRAAVLFNNERHTYHEVISGLEIGQDVLLLPSSDLILSQERFRKWMGDVVGVPGMKSDEDDED